MISTVDLQSLLLFIIIIIIIIIIITVPGPSVIPAASIYSQSIFLLYYAMFEVLLIVKTNQKNRYSPL